MSKPILEANAVVPLYRQLMEKLQKEYDIQREEKQEKEKTEQVEKEEQIFPKKVQEESAPKL